MAASLHVRFPPLWSAAQSESWAGPSTQRPIGRVEADEPATCELKVSGRMLSEVRENTVQCVPREYIYPVIWTR